VCFVHNTSLSTSKLDVKSYNCVFVGYSSGKKRYKCYDPVKKMMFESLDVTFRETEPYFVLSNAQSNVSPVTFQDTLEVIVTLPSNPIGREGDHRVSNNGTENTMDVSPNTRSSPQGQVQVWIRMRIRIYHLQPGRSIKCTLENLVMRMLSNYMSRININYLYLSTALPHHNLQAT
jgi:hypothetical protein